jgi:hypothetical protein
MTTEIFGSRGSAGTPAESLDDKARRAVSNFRSLQPTLTTYARILTGKREVRVVAAATDNGSTDGEVINFRPPLALGDTTLHVRRYCDKRDEDGIHLCEACRIREEVLVTIYHEIAHICFESFQPTTEQDKLQAIKFAVREAKGKWAEQIAQRIQAAPPYKTRDYINLVSLINEYLPFLLNALEDARVNRELFKARPGVKRMFDADTEKIFREGFEARKPDGSFTTAKWSEAPLNNQMMIGCFCKASGYDYHGWFHADVVRDLDDVELTALINQMDTVRSAQSVYNLSFKVLARLRELGYCGTPQDPDPEPEPEPEANAEPESSDESEPDKEGSPDSDDLPSESGSSGESDERDGESDADNDAASEESEEGEPKSEDDQSSGGSEGDDSDGSDGSPGDEESDGTGDDSEDSEESSGSGDAESEDSGKSDGEQSGGASSGTEGDLGDTDDSTDESSSNSENDRGGDEIGEDSEGQTEAGSSSDSPTESGDGSEGGSDSRESGGTDEEGEESESSAVSSGDQSRSSVDEEDNLDESESGTGDQGDLGDSDLGGSSGLDADTDGSREAGEEDDSSEQSGMEAPHEDASVSESEEDGDALDTGADDGYGGTQTDQESKPEFGSVDDLTGILEIWGDHEEKPKSAFEQHQEKIENDAVDKAVIQGIYFTRPSQKVIGVREHLYGQPIIIGGVNYSDAWRGTGQKRLTGAIADLDLPETLLQPALLKMRRAFTDNQRGSHLKNRRSGRVNSSALGKRAWSGDDRLFQKNKLPGKKNYFVVIGMDISGSTVGMNLALEKRAIMAQATMLDRVGIPFAIYAHTGNYHNSYQGTKSGFDLEIYHIKDPKEPWTDKEKERLENIKSSSANIDGHALEYLRKVCDGRTETDRIIMYYSDGKMPAENFKEELEILTSEIQTCKTKGYTLLGVGIRTDSPRQHGLDTVEVWKDEDLLKVITHLEKRLSETNRR